MTLDDRPEAPDRQLVAVDFAVGLNGGASRRLVDQRHLAEGVPRAELADLLAMNGDGRLATFDHDERTAGLALLGDRLAGGVCPLDELAGQPVEELVVGLGEQRNAANQLDAGAGHGRILTCPTGRLPWHRGTRTSPARHL